MQRQCNDSPNANKNLYLLSTCYNGSEALMTQDQLILAQTCFIKQRGGHIHFNHTKNEEMIKL